MVSITLPPSQLPYSNLLLGITNQGPSLLQHLPRQLAGGLGRLDQTPLSLFRHLRGKKDKRLLARLWLKSKVWGFLKQWCNAKL